MKKTILFSALVAFVIQSSFAGGYRVNVQGVREIGMGHAGVALTGDASALFFNPAALTQMNSQYSVVLGGTGIVSKATYVDDFGNRAQTDNPLSTPFNAYFGYKVNEKFALGFGVYTPYGSVVDWGDNWAHNDMITKIELQAIYFQPTVAYQVNKWLSIGAGFTYATGSLNMQKSLASALPGSGLIEMKDNVSNYGYNVGIHLNPIEKLNIGFSYRSRIIMHAKDGTAALDIPAPYQAMGLQTNDTWTSELPMPAELTWGATYQVTKRWLVALDMTYAFWGIYKDLTVDFANNPIGNYPPGSTVSKYERNYKDAMTLHVGTEYQFNPMITGRLGYYYDPTPSPSAYFSPETPTCNTNGYSGGLTIALAKNIKLDFAYLYVAGNPRYVDVSAADTGVGTPLKGTFGLSASVISAGLRFAF